MKGYDSYIDVYKCVEPAKTQKKQIKVTKKRIPDQANSEDCKPILEEWHPINEFTEVISDFDGLPILINYLFYRYINYIRKKAGVKFNLYWRRHMFSSNMYRNKVNPKVIKDLRIPATEDLSPYYAISTEEEAFETIKRRS